MKPTPELSLIVFAFNEEDNVAPVLSEIDEWAQSRPEEVELIFVDDESAGSVESEKVIKSKKWGIFSPYLFPFKKSYSPRLGEVKYTPFLEKHHGQKH